MATVPIRDDYFEILTALGDVESGIDLALQRFALERIAAKITELRKRDARYQAEYGLDYPAFAERIAQDETFVRQIESHVRKTWEVDLADWELCHKGVEDWSHKLQRILLA